MNSILNFIRNQPVRFFALVCVACTSAYVMYMGYWLTQILSSPGWCNRTVAADKVVTDSNFDALQACIGLLTIQLKSLATGSFIYGGVIAMCLLTLMVIVVAGGHFSLAASKTGVTANIGKDEVEKAVSQVVEAADDKATEIVEHGKVTAPEGEA